MSDTYYVLALGHSPALVVVATTDAEDATRIAARYCLEQRQPVVVTRSEAAPLTPEALEERIRAQANALEASVESATSKRFRKLPEPTS